VINILLVWKLTLRKKNLPQRIKGLPILSEKKRMLKRTNLAVKTQTKENQIAKNEVILKEVRNLAMQVGMTVESRKLQENGKRILGINQTLQNVMSEIARKMGRCNLNQGRAKSAKETQTC
jgi:hypothetical protein